MGWLVFMGWIMSQANEWEDYSNYLGKWAGISRNWATTCFFGLFWSWSLWVCHLDADVLQ